MRKLLSIFLLFLFGCDFGLNAPKEDVNGIYLEVIGTHTTYPEIMLIGKDKAYGIENEKIDVFDIQNRAKIKKIESFSLGKDDVNSATIKDSYIYLTTITHKFIVLDISSSPKIIGRLEIGHRGGKVEVDGNYAYISTRNYLLIIDISSPTNPVLVNEVYIFNIRDFIVENKKGYILYGNYYYGGYLSVYDFSDPKNPIESFKKHISPYSRDIVKNDSYLYIIIERYICVFKIKSSNNIVFIRGVQFPRELKELDFDKYGVTSDNLMLYLLDISCPSYPCMTEQLLGGGRSITIQGDYIYYLYGPQFIILKIQKIK